MVIFSRRIQWKVKHNMRGKVVVDKQFYKSILKGTVCDFQYNSNQCLILTHIALKHSKYVSIFGQKCELKHDTEKMSTFHFWEILFSQKIIKILSLVHMIIMILCGLMTGIFILDAFPISKLCSFALSCFIWWRNLKVQDKSTSYLIK